MVTSHTDQYTKRLSCINNYDHTHQAQPNHLGVGVINMERATQDGYITNRPKHEKIIMHQPSWSYASKITHPSWHWIYQHGKSYARWLHHTPIKTRKVYHASTFMIISIKQTKPNHLGFGVLSMERATQNGYITHRSKHKKIIMYQPSWSYASSKTQPSWLWSYEHGKSYARWLPHTPIKTRKNYHASTFMIIRIKQNPTILDVDLWAWKELHKMVTSHTDQNTKKLSCTNLHDHTHQA